MTQVSRRAFLSALGGLGGAVIFSCRVHGDELLRMEDRGASWHERAWPLMGTFVRVAVFHYDRAYALETLSSVLLELKREIEVLSNWSPTSTISHLSRSGYSRSYRLPEIVHELFSVGEFVRSATRGGFNLFGGELYQVWRDSRKSNTLPDPGHLSECLDTCADAHAAMHSGKVVALPAVSVDVGGIGKGLIADTIVAMLGDRGVSFARVDCGGDIRFLGPLQSRVKRENSWTVQIENPRQEGEFLGSIEVGGNPGIATSGDYRNSWKVNGKTYHHLIDPRSGRPGEENHQVTVIAPTATLADGLASGYFFLSQDEIAQSVHRLRGVTALVVDRDYKLHSVGEAQIQWDGQHL